MAKGYVAAGLLLVIPIVLVLLVPLYNRTDPQLYGLPFFWWFQGLMLVVAAVMYLVAAFILERGDTDKGDA